MEVKPRRLENRKGRDYQRRKLHIREELLVACYYILQIYGYFTKIKNSFNHQIYTVLLQNTNY
jgi:hypothetical protein